MTVLVIAEHDHRKLKMATMNTVAAASKLGQLITVLVAGQDAEGAARAAATLPGIAEVLHADDAAYAHFLPENMAALIAKLAAGYSHVLAPATGKGRAYMPRAAALCGTAQISEISDIADAETFLRPIYAGAAIATVRSRAPVRFATIRLAVFDPAAATGGNAPVRKIDGAGETGLSKFLSIKLVQSERPSLPDARIVVAGGRGLGSAENFVRYLAPFADKLGAALGASRAAVDAGYASYECLVGQSGKSVAPEIYFAIGISGAIQHLAGMKDSKTIVAINKDVEAEIFKIADIGIIGDIADILPKLTEAVRPRTTGAAVLTL